MLPVQDGGSRSWMHFRAPDGFVCELVEDWRQGGMIRAELVGLSERMLLGLGRAG